MIISSNCQAAKWPVSDTDCLAANIYHEARGENIHGQWFVAYVSQNRLRHRYFPNSYCEVIKQYKQFSWWDDPKIIKKPDDPWSWDIAYHIAKKFINKDPITRHDASEGALFYHKYDILPYWADDYIYIGRVGAHLAYK